MSAPDTNVSRQAHQHKTPLWGIIGGLAAVAALFVAFLIYTSYQGGTPVAPEEQTRWGQGEPVVNQPNEATSDAAENPALPTATSGAEGDQLTPIQNNPTAGSQTVTPGADATMNSGPVNEEPINQ